MFRPNQFCYIKAQNGYDKFGMTAFGRRKRERCAIVKCVLATGKSSVRADSSGSRGNAREVIADLIILLEPKTSATHDAIIEFQDDLFVIKSMHKRFDIRGKIDHFEVECTFWSDKE